MLKNLLVLVVAMTLVSAAALAAATFPSQCKVSGLRYHNGQLVLFAQHTAKPRLYAIHNISRHAIWVVHEGSDKGMGAGWDSQLSAHQWTAILMMHRLFAFNCNVSLRNDNMKTVPCQSVLRVCQFSQWYAKYPISAGYWVAEDLPLPKMLSQIRARGFVLQ